MRMIEVGTDVFAKIWSHRLPGEETEDAILRRLLGTANSAEPTSKGEAAAMSRTLWRDDVRSALQNLGGTAHLLAIYEKVREIRRAAGRRLPPSSEAIIRRELEYNSSDSESFTGHHDWFRSAEGIGAGVWALRA